MTSLVALDREIQIDADIFKMQAAKVTFSNIEQAIAYENLTISGGSLTNNGTRNTVRIKGQFGDMQTIRDIVVQSSSGAMVKLSDIADVNDSYEEQASFARLDGKNVITLNVIKKNGANLLDASDQIKDIVADLKERDYPKDVNVTITGDQSRFTRKHARRAKQHDHHRFYPGNHCANVLYGLHQRIFCRIIGSVVDVRGLHDHPRIRLHHEHDRHVRLHLCPSELLLTMPLW